MRYNNVIYYTLLLNPTFWLVEYISTISNRETQQSLEGTITCWRALSQGAKQMTLHIGLFMLLWDITQDVVIYIQSLNKSNTIALSTISIATVTPFQSGGYNSHALRRICQYQEFNKKFMQYVEFYEKMTAQIFLNHDMYLVRYNKTNSEFTLGNYGLIGTADEQIVPSLPLGHYCSSTIPIKP